MIDLNHKYALLKDGTIEPLWYNYDHSDPNNQRMAYKDEDGKYYLDHDIYFEFMGKQAQAYVHDEIIRTADTEGELKND